MDSQRTASAIMVACPDARPPAYEAVIGLSRAGRLDRFVTSTYYDPEDPLARLARRVAPGPFGRCERSLLRRHHPEIPAGCVKALPAVDVALSLEGRAARAARNPRLKRLIAQARTHWFDRRLARLVARRLPSALLVFSDVGSGVTLPLCNQIGVPAVLSMVHGDVREETEILDAEAIAAPDFFPIYLGDGMLDRDEIAWLHRRRLRDLALADLILVPSDHIADTLEHHGTPREKIRVIPYAADCRRFIPLTDKPHRDDACTFLFAGGITQRKGIKYLLEAWAKVKRPGWTLQLLGPLPRNPGPLAGLLGDVELLGRVGHAEMPSRMAAADVFVFPSLFEGSAVVTYEAIACGLPSVVTPSAGSVVREGVEGFLISPRDVDSLAQRMTTLGESADLRRRMSAAARARAVEFDWPRYHAAVIDALDDSCRTSTETTALAEVR